MSLRILRAVAAERDQHTPMIEKRTHERAKSLAESRMGPLHRALAQEFGRISQDLITRGLHNSTLLVSGCKAAAEANLAKRAEVIASSVQETCERHGVRQTPGLADELTAVFDEVYAGQVRTVEREFGDAVPDAARRLCPDTQLHVDVRMILESLVLFSEGLSPAGEEAVASAEGSARRPKVFICHARQDAELAADLFDRLEAAGADPWLDKRCLVVGDDWEYEIGKAVASADAFVVCLRPGFDEIGFRQQEVHWAIKALQLRPPGQGFIVPFIVEPCTLPEWCKSLHAGGDLSKPTSFEDLLGGIEKRCRQKLVRRQLPESQAPQSRPQQPASAGDADASSSSFGSVGLSELAVTLLTKAVDSDGRLLVSEHLGGVSYGSVELKGRNHREMVRHDGALKELTDRGLLDRRVPPSAKTSREAVYEVTANGYALHEKLGQTGAGG